MSRRALFVLSILIGGACLAAIMVPLLVASEGHAHQAPSGMDYDASCCGGHDCRQLSDSDVPKELQAVADGWLIIPTGEHFRSDDRSHVKTSTDGHFHRCSASNGAINARTYCLYIPAAA